MLRAVIRYDDIGAPVGIDRGGVFFGRSSIVPFAHRMLQTQVLDNRHRTLIICAERYADDDPGVTFVSDATDRDFRAAHRCVASHQLDCATLAIDKDRGTVAYRASEWNSAPVFMIGDGATVAIDWDYARLLAARPMEIDWPALLARIAGTAPYSPRTMVDGLYRSTAGATLTAGAGRIAVRYPRASAYPGPQQVEPGADIDGALFQTIVALLEARPMAAERTAVELSGGMDSALTAMAVAHVIGPGVISTGAQFDGEMGAAQRARRRMLCERGGFHDFEVPALRFAPFGPASHRRHRGGVWPEDENYPELFEMLFGALAAAGIDTLVAGLGGDELYIAYEGEEPPHDALTLEGSRYVSPAGKRLAGSGMRPYPPGRLQESCWKAAAGRSQRLLRHGIWPVYPYHSTDLAAFVASLPVEYRRDRTLLRRTLTRVTGDAVFETDYIKEGFRDVAVRGVRDNQAWLTDTAERSGLLGSPYLDGDFIRAQLAADPDQMSDRDFNYLYFFLTICCFFQPRP